MKRKNPTASKPKLAPNQQEITVITTYIKPKPKQEITVIDGDMLAGMNLLETAHHEAAHAVFHVKLGQRLGRVTIKPNQQLGSLGHAEVRHPKWINEQPATLREEARLRVQAESEILSLYAGRIAQGKYTGRKIKWGHDSDYNEAMNLATSFVSGHDDVRHAFLVYCQKQSAQLVDAWWPEIQAVAHALTERDTLTAREVREAIAAIPAEVYDKHRKARAAAAERERKQRVAKYRKQLK